MMSSNLNYNYKGGSYNADVTVIDSLYWLFSIHTTKENTFTLQFDFFTDTWRHGSNNFIDPELIQVIGDGLMKIFGKDIQSHRSNYLFSSQEYYFCRINQNNMIGFWGKKLRIRVIQTLAIEPNINDLEIHYHGIINNTDFFFETENYNGEDRGLIMRAIGWYAVYISHPLVKIKSM